MAVYNTKVPTTLVVKKRNIEVRRGLNGKGIVTNGKEDA